jgi:hypothetical protein
LVGIDDSREALLAELRRTPYLRTPINKRRGDGF